MEGEVEKPNPKSQQPTSNGYSSSGRRGCWRMAFGSVADRGRDGDWGRCDDGLGDFDFKMCKSVGYGSIFFGLVHTNVENEPS